MDVSERCWVIVSDDDEQIVTGVSLGERPITYTPPDGFVMVEYVRADTLRGAVPQDDYDRVSRALDQRNIEVERLKNTLDTAHRDWRREVDALRQQLRGAV